MVTFFLTFAGSGAGDRQSGGPDLVGLAHRSWTKEERTLFFLPDVSEMD